MSAHETNAQMEADAMYARSLCRRACDALTHKSVQVGAPFRCEPVCETERFNAEVRSLECIAEPFATGTCASVCARVHVHSTMLCSDSNCRSRKHRRKTAAVVDSELVSALSSPAARAKRLASGCC